MDDLGGKPLFSETTMIITMNKHSLKKKQQKLVVFTEVLQTQKAHDSTIRGRYVRWNPGQVI